MKGGLMIILGLCLLPALAEGVTVQVENLTFSWESVKALKEILDRPAPLTPRARSRGPVPVCSHPQLPHEFLSLCSTPKASSVIRALNRIASDPEPCEICFNVACSGC